MKRDDSHRDDDRVVIDLDEYKKNRKRGDDQKSLDLVIKNNQVVRSLSNHVKIFTGAGIYVQYDTLKDRLRCSLPGSEREAMKDVTDSIILNIRGKMEDLTDGLIFSDTQIRDTLMFMGYQHSHNAAATWLNSLPKWDGRRRFKRLCIALKLDDSRFSRQSLKMMFRAAYYRANTPGCEVQFLWWLIGDEGGGKSTALKTIFRHEMGWYNETPVDITNKDGLQTCHGFWVNEMSENSSFGKKEASEQKSFISRVDDTYRSAYGRISETHKRSFILVGTANLDGGNLINGLGDNRRHIVLMSDSSRRRGVMIDLDWIRSHRDDLWTETVYDCSVLNAPSWCDDQWFIDRQSAINSDLQTSPPNTTVSRHP